VRWALPLALLTLGVPAAGAAGAASTAPETLAVAAGPIAAFAQDGNRVAWFRWMHGRTCNASIFVRTVSGNGTSRLPSTGSTCRFPGERFPVRLALSGSRAAWTLTAAGNITEQYLFSASLGAPRERQVAVLYHLTDSTGSWLTGLAGDRGTIAFSVVNTRYTDESASQLEIGGVLGGLSRAPIEVPAAKVALSGWLAATARATGTDRGGLPVAGPHTRVELWNLRTRERLGWFAPTGTVRALAYSSPWIVAFVGDGQERRLLVRHTPSGLSSSTNVARDASNLTASADTAVYREGRTLVAVDLRTRTRRVLHRAAATPVGLSIEGRRVAWAENVGGRGRIRALLVSQR
jgi:hypothetical protein